MALPFPAQFVKNVTAPFGNGEQGVDIGLKQGTVLYAVGAGTVRQNLNWTAPGHPVGWAAELKTAAGDLFRYGHVSKFLVPNGSQVIAGQPIALSGGQIGTPGAGESTGPHVEFQYHPGGGAPVDPVPWLNQQAAALGGSVQLGMGSTDTTAVSSGGCKSLGDS